ncbi:acyl-CoA carboxylase epsilon subunit [Streptomyces sp. NPDC057376]|uniref:acyl-CoA carboxylase epsilon subunit n=1 Tax=unclassified Streptomyces TaxID=2593676 RepID=UPI00093C4EBF|nr:acyl-CoA carboxylase epsilon subunit [Streptomyces sp. CB02414]OKI81347.1 hypothetical protein AMK11_25605 [Streptomyces sp. CB02414]
MTTSATLLRVEKGHAGPEELAAITAVLLARAAARPADHAATSAHARATAGWRRLERQTAFESPRAWRNGVR